jgi:stage V sporulation protein SpoVS
MNTVNGKTFAFAAAMAAIEIDNELRTALKKEFNQ